MPKLVRVDDKSVNASVSQNKVKGQLNAKYEKFPYFITLFHQQFMDLVKESLCASLMLCRVNESVIHDSY